MEALDKVIQQTYRRIDFVKQGFSDPLTQLYELHEWLLIAKESQSGGRGYSNAAADQLIKIRVKERMVEDWPHTTPKPQYGCLSDFTTTNVNSIAFLKAAVFYGKLFLPGETLYVAWDESPSTVEHIYLPSGELFYSGTRLFILDNLGDSIEIKPIAP